MANEIIPYVDMCQREGYSLQRGMNFGLGGWYSVLLMSVRSNAPYRDRFDEDGTLLIYEGHDEKRRSRTHDPKLYDQPEYGLHGTLTENGKFYQAAVGYRHGERPAELVRIYEKLHQGIWSYNGTFQLVNAERVFDGTRFVFEFILAALATDIEAPGTIVLNERRRIIPTAVKLEVWKRDGARCVMCGATDHLHFDHIIPYSKGGTSIKAENVQLLCARHNLAKSDRIE